MILEDDHIVLAAEYVLGTLDAPERAIAEGLLASEPDFAALVEQWERRFGELNAMVVPIEPPADLIGKIRAQLPQAEQAASIHLPEPAGVSDAPARLGVAPQLEMPIHDGVPHDGTPAPVGSVTAGQALDQHFPEPSANVAMLSARVRRWRGAGTAFAALAAALAAVFVTSIVQPELLPEQLRPKPRTVEVVKTVEKLVEIPGRQTPSRQTPSRFVAVLQRDAVSPAFILTVDPDDRSMTVRRVAPETPAGKSYELWLVSSKYAAPRSLGVIGNDEFSKSTQLAGYDPDTISEATYAISLEPEGGSPTGVATGPILWSGKLIEAAPPEAKP